MLSIDARVRRPRTLERRSKDDRCRRQSSISRAVLTPAKYKFDSRAVNSLARSAESSSELQMNQDKKD